MPQPRHPFCFDTIRCLSKYQHYNDLPAPSKSHTFPRLGANGPTIAPLLTEGAGRSHVIRVRISQNSGIVSLTPGNRTDHLKKVSCKPKRASGSFHQASPLAQRQDMLTMLHMIRLDYLSCVLTVLATVLIGKRLWQGWVVAALNSAVVCVIGIRTAQFGFVPANLLCIALYTSNLVNWRPKKQPE